MWQHVTSCVVDPTCTQVNTLRSSVTEIATVTENVCDLSSVSGVVMHVPIKLPTSSCRRRRRKTVQVLEKNEDMRISSQD
jgi:hypothetical protein